MAGLWRRNGLPIHRQAVHYSGVPFCLVFRDLDLGALQLAALYLGFDPLLTLLLDRFSILHWASTTQPAGQQPPSSVDKRATTPARLTRAVYCCVV